MKKLSKIVVVMMAFVMMLSITGCGEKKEKNLEGTLSELMRELYKGAGINEEEDFMFLEDKEVTEENLSYYLGVKELDYKEALASESMVGSTAHSIVLVRMNKGADIEQAKKDIKEKVDPRKWICVGVEDENVIVDNIGDVIVLIMNNDYAKKLSESFKELGK
ncbi:MAG: DUF4358 domain-containing protein [Bacilli bacterium]|jgi:hypothetical protein|nr:DUF4358 domain-containing protein [Bacilli bacterium]